MIQILVGVFVEDEAGYATYRQKMTPLLHAHGGRFVVDTKVSEVLLNPSDQPFNRLFSIEFPSDTERRAFFEHPEYLAIRAAHFSPSVSAVASLGEFQPVRS